jgi:hypothetical protein
VQTRKYRLDGHEVVPVDDLLEWCKWMAAGDYIVKQETIGEYWISTVFLGLDHRLGDGLPLVFETMVFRNQRDEDGSRPIVWCERSSTWDEAEEGQERAAAWVRNGAYPQRN